MGLLRYQDYLRPPGDGLAELPECPGIYAVFNRITRRFYVGRAINIRTRCVQHRSSLRHPRPGCRMGQDAKRHGIDSFLFVALQVMQLQGVEADIAAQLEANEVKWIIDLESHTEEHGYNKMIGRAWTLAARFRDHERKLLRRGIRFMPLPWADMGDMLNPELIRSWVEG